MYLECNIRANPWVSEVTWQFEDHYVSSNKSAGVIISNQTLVLQSVRREHRGRYRCLAGNSEGNSISEYLHLLVQCKYSMLYFCNVYFYNYIIYVNKIVVFNIFLEVVFAFYLRITAMVFKVILIREK